MFLLFLKRERERFQLFVRRRFWSFSVTTVIVPERSMRVFDRFMFVFDRLWHFYDLKSSEKCMKRSETARNVGSSGTLDGLKRLQNHVNGTSTITLQKWKKHCNDCMVIYTADLSFLKRDFADVSDRSSCTAWSFQTDQLFLTIHERPTVQTVPERLP